LTDLLLVRSLIQMRCSASVEKMTI